MIKTKLSTLLCIAAIFFTVPLFAATRNYTVNCQTKIIRDGVVRYRNRHHTYNFNIQLISDTAGTKHESTRYSRPFVTAEAGERYSIILHNPMPIKVAVNLTIDGLNSITGKPCEPSNGSKWIIEPYSYVTIRGWQVGSHDARRFYFTSKDKSYAKWRSNKWGQDLSVNCGVIGAAYFFNKRDLEEYFEGNPVYEYTKRRAPSGRWFGFKKESSSSLESLDEYEQKAGTGMGETESHPVELVHFKYNTGMYKPREAVIIYYDFADARVHPQPFLEMDFAPEQPSP